MKDELREKSKYLSYLLRHKPEEAKCTLDNDGYVDVKTLLENTDFTMELLEELVEKDTRYALSHDKTKIKAFHGHSKRFGINYKVDNDTPPVLYHGTSVKNYELIKQTGMIKSMSRQNVHLSGSEEQAKLIGKRHGNPIVLFIDSERMLKDGFVFCKSEDNVYLTSDIPIKYIIKVV